MHPKALEQVASKVEGSLKQCHIKDNWPVYESFEVHVDSLAKELLKHKDGWITISDVYSIFYDLVFEGVTAKAEDDNKLSGRLWDVLGEQDGLELKRTLVSFYSSIPRKYDVYVPLAADSPQVSSADVSERFSIAIFETAADVPGGHADGFMGLFDALAPRRAYFRYRIDGYCSSSLQNMTVRKALSNFKIAYQQGIARNVFKIVRDKPSGLGVFGGLTHYQVEKAKLVSVDKTAGANRVVSSELPLDVSKLLKSSELDVADSVMESATSTNTLMRYLKSAFRLPSLLMENDEVEAKRIKAASQWCFDSYATENDTMSFLQTCFGLESLFGEDSGEDSKEEHTPLTRTLADRCAYLVGTDIKGRKTIRQKFRELYAIRSKLVHGTSTFLDPSQAHYLRWGRTVLEYAIMKEIKHLAMES